MNVSNSTSPNCTVVEAEDGKSSHVLFVSFLSLQVVLGAVGWLGSSIVLFCQTKSRLWPFYQNILFCNVTVAAVITAAIHCVQGCFQLVKFDLTGEGDLGDSKWSDVAGDSAHVSVAFGLMTLAFQNLYALYNQDKCLGARKSDQGNKVTVTEVTVAATMLICIWTSAFGLTSLGVNPHPEVEEDGDPTMRRVSYGIHLTIQISVSISVWITKRISRRLETDFAVRRAQQNLNTRTHLKKTIDVTAAITRVLILHIITWVASFTAAFLINRLFESNGNPCIGDVIEEQNENNLAAAFNGIVDCLALTFEASYPFVLCCKQTQLKKAMKKVGCCSKFQTTPTNTPVTAPVFGTTGKQHRLAINDYWEMVATTKYRDVAIPIGITSDKINQSPPEKGATKCPKLKY